MKPYKKSKPIEEGIINAPYTTIITKITVHDENGTRSYWQINRWQRFKLFIIGIFYKSKKL